MDVRGDFLVVGSGIAGLRAALTLAEAGDVIVLTIKACDGLCDPATCSCAKVPGTFASCPRGAHASIAQKDVITWAVDARHGGRYHTARGVARVDSSGAQARSLSLGLSRSRRHKMAEARL